MEVLKVLRSLPVWPVPWLWLVIWGSHQRMVCGVLLVGWHHQWEYPQERWVPLRAGWQWAGPVWVMHYKGWLLLLERTQSPWLGVPPCISNCWGGDIGQWAVLQSTPIFSPLTQYSIGTSARDTAHDLSATSATAATSSSSSASSATATPCSLTTISQLPWIAYGHRPKRCTTTDSIHRLSITLLPDPVPIVTTSISQNPADHPAHIPRSHRACQWQR